MCPIGRVGVTVYCTIGRGGIPLCLISRGAVQ